MSRIALLLAFVALACSTAASGESERRRPACKQPGGTTIWGQSGYAGPAYDDDQRIVDAVCKQLARQIGPISKIKAIEVCIAGVTSYHFRVRVEQPCKKWAEGCFLIKSLHLLIYKGRRTGGGKIRLIAFNKLDPSEPL